MKYTIIYNKRWQSGSHWHCLTKVARIIKKDDESFADCLIRYGLEEMVEYIFEGWPLIHGETEGDLKEFGS